LAKAIARDFTQFMVAIDGARSTAHLTRGSLGQTPNFSRNLCGFRRKLALATLLCFWTGEDEKTQPKLRCWMGATIGAGEVEAFGNRSQPIET
jgi:hypothetical protein